MNLFKVTVIVLLFSTVFVSCKKERVLVPEMTTSEKPLPAVKPVEGVWTGKYYSLDKSVPVYLGFNIKADGKLDIMNAAKQTIGSGTWELNATQFKASLKFLSSGEVYSFAGELFESTRKLAGTWGHNSSDSDAGFWDIDKVD